MSLREPFEDRHFGPRPAEIVSMLGTLGLSSLDALTDRAVPRAIRMSGELDLPAPRTEEEAIAALRALAADNDLYRSFIGMGYHDTVTPPVILRNVLENPAWYTAYTPYQAEIAQGRLEALLLFQMMVQDLTAVEISNASLLDEATAAAEAMAMSWRNADDRHTFLVADHCHPQTIAVVKTRADALGLTVTVVPYDRLAPDADTFGVLVQSPDTWGILHDTTRLSARCHEAGAVLTVAADLLACTLSKAPGELGADIVIGSSQRFGVPMGFGGPHAAFLATTDAHKRRMPGRIIGLSRDAQGRDALRMALQTREQHIRRERATSNVCTAQVLLAVVAAMYAVWHGPEGLVRIARRVHGQARALAAALEKGGFVHRAGAFFDTLTVDCGDRRAAVLASAEAHRVDLRVIDDGRSVGIALDEATTDDDLRTLFAIFGVSGDPAPRLGDEILAGLRRTSPFLEHPRFHAYRSETEMLRYLYRLQQKDLALTTAMIPLGSCTMKLNATTEMAAVTWPEFARVHPFAPPARVRGYTALIDQLCGWLAEITGFAAVSMQPNAGSQGEYTGLLVIRAWHHAHDARHRDVCLIPTSAHGTNPASAVMAGLRVVAVQCDEAGNIDVDDLRRKAAEHADKLSCLMVTYPSTHGVFEESIVEICQIVHEHGGQVYMDGANYNAMVGLCRPGDFGPDVCHLNLHKTFCIPHGGGGPGMGPIGVAAHLAPFLPGHPVVQTGGEQAIGPVSAAPFGSPSILPIPWAYIALMGASGLKKASQIAILNANYVAKRLEGHYDVLYTGRNGLVAHECILDCRPFKTSASVDDIAKRLVDYGFHAPTMSFPVAGTLMVEPTESEGKAEIDRLVDALIAIRDEIRAVEEGRLDALDNPLRNAPHTADVVAADAWNHPYSRELAAFPTRTQRAWKYWPSVGRVDNVYGDKHMCTCLPLTGDENG